ncbi:hypothetical protein [Tuwongella immobilis]|uniref:hypothetical protein n=1 Tax=Tuwongella immobilis TaxID=692036 RepID=UPI001E31E1B4|nr:hypothetical protein [Tuwongella immobilis]
MRDIFGTLQQFSTAEIAEAVRSDQQDREARSDGPASNIGGLYKQRARRFSTSQIVRYAEGIYRADGTNWIEIDFSSSSQSFEIGISLTGKKVQFIRHAIVARARALAVQVIFGGKTARTAVSDIYRELSIPFSHFDVQAEIADLGLSTRFTDSQQIVHYFTFRGERYGMQDPAIAPEIFPDDWEVTD